LAVAAPEAGSYSGTYNDPHLQTLLAELLGMAGKKKEENGIEEGKVRRKREGGQQREEREGWNESHLTLAHFSFFPTPTDSTAGAQC